MRTPAVLLILDGFGIAPPAPNNAISAADMKHFRYWQKKCSSELEASGEVVGLPPGKMGSSQVNHLNMGAGRVVPQAVVRINDAIEDGSFFENAALVDAMQRADERIHFVGLVSDGGVHSHIDHLHALIKMARDASLEPVVHAALDGRDTAAKAAERFLDQLDDTTIATLMGRYYALDRDNRWERTSKAYHAMVGAGEPVGDWRGALSAAYEAGESDEFVTPVRVVDAPVTDGDVLIFFDFRSDRPRQLTRAFIEEEFSGFERRRHPDVHMVQMTQYDEHFGIPTAFEPLELKNVLGEWLAEKGCSQLHIAETEKYAHVTFFFNGGREEPFPGEDREIIPSPPVATYDLAPRMSVDAVTDFVVEDLKHQGHDAYIINFANSDMVGHTGVFDATVQALEAIDECIGLLADEVLQHDGFLIITADHGNAEQMDGDEQKTHTTNKVPLVVVDKHTHVLEDGAMYDVAPTLLDLMGLEQPAEMTGSSRIKHDAYK